MDALFANPSTLAALTRQLVRRLVRHPAPTLRAWVVGCGTGEDAYACALVLGEAAEQAGSDAQATVFATESDASQLATARAGVYPPALLAQLTLSQRQQFVPLSDDRAQAHEPLRERIIFATHQLLRDPPFAHLDLVICRDRCASLDGAQQVWALEQFAQALSPGGLLLSTILPPDNRSFRQIDHHAPLYRCRAAPAQRHAEAVGWGVTSARPAAPGAPLPALPALVVDAQLQIVHIGAGTERFLRIRSGAPSYHLLDVIHPDLRGMVTQTLTRSLRHGHATESQPVPVRHGALIEFVTISVQPGTTERFAPGSLQVTIDPVEPEVAPSPEATGTAGHVGITAPVARREMLSPVPARAWPGADELLSANTELRAANEELAAHKEELQTLNEELLSSNQQQRETLAELTQVNTDLSNLLASTAIATLFLDQELCIKRYTPALEALFPLIPKDTNRPLAHIKHQLDYPELLDDARQIVGQGAVIERVVRHADGRWFLSRLTPYQTVERRADGVVLTFVDISARVQAEAALRELNASLEQRVAERTLALQEREEHLRQTNAELTRALRLKDEFLAMMSHELRTPLNIILGVTEALSEGLYEPLVPRQRQALEMVTKSGRHLLSILSDILDLARIAAGRERLDRQPIAVDILCQNAILFVRDSAHAKGVQLHAAVAPGIQGLYGDERRLTQILVNLLSNAVKFTPGGGQVGLEVVADQREEWLQFSVWDTGIGIAEADQVRVFEPFVQVDARLAREYGGTGLGLALVRRLTELHGGSIRLASAPGKGSRFTVSLPWPAQERGVSVAEKRSKPEGPRLARALRILAVDDDMPTLDLYAEVLRQQGWQVTTAGTGEEALVLVQAAQPDVVVLDINLPGMDGLDVIRQIRGKLSSGWLPIIALTALAMPGDRERCLAAGASAYLAKPVGLQTLLETITSVLARNTEGGHPGKQEIG